MTKDFKRKKMRQSVSMSVKRLSRVSLFILIIVMIPFVSTLVIRNQKPDRFTGIVESESETVGSINSSRIISIEVYPGQSVKPGDVLVRLEPTDRAMELAMNQARLMDYEQSLLRYEQTQLQYRQSLQESARKYRQLVEEAAVELEQEKMNKARDEAELTGLEEEIKHLQPLVEKRVVSELELTALRPRIATLKITIKQYKPLTNALQHRLDQTKSALNEVMKLQVSLDFNKTLNPLELSLKKARESCTHMEVVEPSVLRATRQGIVSRIQHQAGDVVSAGDPIVRIASQSSLYIIGLLPQSQGKNVTVGEKLSVIRITEQRENVVLTTEVESLDPEVMDLIDPFNPSPRVPLRGRRVRLRIINEKHNLVPGETVFLQPPETESTVDNIMRCFIPGNGTRQQNIFTTGSQ
jgi:multidrug resistance efflux pump